MQVTLGICSNGTWKDVTGISLLQSLCVFEHDLHIAHAFGPHIDENRETIIRQAIEAKSGVLVFVDADMAWPQISLNQLIEAAPSRDILGVPYNEKRLPPVSTVKLFDKDGGIATGILQMPHETFRCAAVGAGFMRIFLSDIQEKWPEGPYFEFGQVGGLGRVGEDVHFCMEAAKRGIETWCDPRIIVRHCGDYLY